MTERKRPYRGGLEEIDTGEQNIQPARNDFTGQSRDCESLDPSSEKEESLDLASPSAIRGPIHVIPSDEAKAESKQMDEYEETTSSKNRDSLQTRSFQEDLRMEPGAFRVQGYNRRERSSSFSIESSSGEIFPERLPTHAHESTAGGSSVPIAAQIDDQAHHELEQTRQEIYAIQELVRGGTAVTAALEVKQANTVASSRRKRLLWIGGIFLLVVGAAIGIGIALSGSDSDSRSVFEFSNSPSLAPVMISTTGSPVVATGSPVVSAATSVGTTFTPTSEPTPSRSSQWYQIVVEVSGAESIQNPESAQWQALEWLQNKDTLPLPNTLQQRIERYAIVVLYFSTNGSQWTNQYNFLNAKEPVCMWNDFENGCDCDFEGNVVELRLSENQLDGELPSEVGRLKYLNLFYASKNVISGTVPSELGRLSNLKAFSIWLDHFHGQIPTELGNMRALTFLDLSVQRSESALTGFIPSELGFLTNLRALSLNHNSLSGNLPTEFRNLSNLNRLQLYNNKLQGNFDPTLCDSGLHFEFGLSADCGESGLVTCSCCRSCY